MKKAVLLGLTAALSLSMVFSASAATKTINFTGGPIDPDLMTCSTPDAMVIKNDVLKAYGEGLSSPLNTAYIEENQNIDFTWEMKLDLSAKKDSWTFFLTFRDSNALQDPWSKEEIQCYDVVINKGELAFRRSLRTGSGDNASRVTDKLITNSDHPLDPGDGKYHKYNLKVEDAAAGVQMTLSIDGAKALTFTDADSAKKITDPGCIEFHTGMGINMEVKFKAGSSAPAPTTTANTPAPTTAANTPTQAPDVSGKPEKPGSDTASEAPDASGDAAPPTGGDSSGDSSAAAPSVNASSDVAVSGDEGGGSHAGLIIAIVAAVVLAAGGGVTYFVIRRKKQQAQ